jgi:hypothetical protein
LTFPSLRETVDRLDLLVCTEDLPVVHDLSEGYARILLPVLYCLCALHEDVGRIGGRVDYVPALCTHRSSLLPIEWLSEAFDWLRDVGITDVANTLRVLRWVSM